MIDDIKVKVPELSKTCPKCDIKHMNDEQYKGQDYCSKCYSKAMEYDADTFRKRHDIRMRDPETLTWYQQAQLNAIQRNNNGPEVS